MTNRHRLNIRRGARLTAALLVAAATLSGCGGSGDGVSSEARRGTGLSAPATAPPPSVQPTTASIATQPCLGNTATPVYDHVVVIMMENRTWDLVGGPGFDDTMPFARSLARHCAYYAHYDETNPRQNSLTQYVGMTSGVDNPRTVFDCSPSPTCVSTDDNIFRRIRTTGGTARNFVEGATAPCSADGNAAKHVPALYFHGTYEDATGTHNDADFCTTEVRPLSELDVDALPTFAFITPTLCNDGHDCDNAAADAFLRRQVSALLAGKSYQEGRTAILVLWDEDRPNPNLFIAPAALPGPRPGTASHAQTLKTITDMLDRPALQPVADETSLRGSAPL